MQSRYTSTDANPQPHPVNQVANPVKLMIYLLFFLQEAKIIFLHPVINGNMFDAVQSVLEQSVIERGRRGFC